MLEWISSYHALQSLLLRRLPKPLPRPLHSTYTCFDTLKSSHMMLLIFVVGINFRRKAIFRNSFFDSENKFPLKLTHYTVASTTERCKI